MLLIYLNNFTPNLIFMPLWGCIAYLQRNIQTCVICQWSNWKKDIKNILWEWHTKCEAHQSFSRAFMQPRRVSIHIWENNGRCLYIIYYSFNTLILIQTTYHLNTLSFSLRITFLLWFWFSFLLFRFISMCDIDRMWATFCQENLFLLMIFLLWNAKNIYYLSWIRSVYRTFDFKF